MQAFTKHPHNIGLCARDFKKILTLKKKIKKMSCLFESASPKICFYFTLVYTVFSGDALSRLALMESTGGSR